MLRRLPPDAREKWLSDLDAPEPGRNPDVVDEKVVEEELSMFVSAQMQAR